MHTQIKKPENNIDKLIANPVAQKKNKNSGFELEDNRTEAVAQRKLQEIISNSQVKKIVKFQSLTNNNTAQLKGKKKKQTANRTFKYSGENSKRLKPEMRQDNVQKYLMNISPADGPVRDYIDNNSAHNGGLCAGWVVLHRNNPDELIRIWNLVSQKIKAGETDELDPKDNDKAVEMYIKAQYHFANDPDNAEYVLPDKDVLDQAGLEPAPKDSAKKILTKNNISVQYGKIYDKAFLILKNYNGSHKHNFFIEIYSKSHTAQVEFRQHKLYSICESEYAGILKIKNNANEAERMLSSAFFDEEQAEPSSWVKLSFDLYKST